ncbi:nucleoside transporter [Desulfovibrio aerotolerans]|uniref:Nucleoside transporter n=1 Tax=Solidesulfovibrio aerotolerans TaxID=295255 RepID=A0A7C9NHV0_9BACT|nr:nucleoside transporter [Solidesulfovibrio aerotolerans]MYL82056.1 nucleoside transporter [Solidesulfovibrio aerotolerans]
MSNGVFLLVLIALGFVFLIYFNRRAKNYQERHPGEKNPIDTWLTGKDDNKDQKL